MLVDPPYDVPDAEVAGWLAAAAAHGWLAERRRGRGRARRPAAAPFAVAGAAAGVRERRYGDTVLHVGTGIDRGPGERDHAAVSGRGLAVTVAP